MRAIETTEIELDRPRLMVFDHEALRLAELELNKWRHGAANAYAWQSIDEFAGMAEIRRTLAGGTYPADFLQIMLWAGLKRDDQVLTVVNAGALITDREYVSQKLFAALEKAWPKAPDNPPQQDSIDKKKADQPTGSTTGLSPASSSH